MKEHDHHSAAVATDFPVDVAALPDARRPNVVELGAGERFELRIAPVRKRVGDAGVRMLAFNGSIPGPVLKVREGTAATIDVVNEGDLETTVHWHGLRLDNRYDGTHETQPPIPVGGTFTYELEFPDPGVYWYHPHIRQDYGQELGLYGNIIVAPAEPDYWPPAHREVPLTLDDVLIEHGRIAPFSPAETTFAAMGRFGNVMLVGGETDLVLEARRGEVVRFLLTNTANTRVFKVAVPGARMKLVGGDSGRVERETLVDSVILAPSERAVLDVLFPEAGRLQLRHTTPDGAFDLASIEVSEDGAEAGPADRFDVLRHNPEWAAERERLAAFVAAPPDKTLAFVAEMNLEAPGGATSYVCPMHPEVVSDKPDRCPKCGMKLVPAGLGSESAGHAHGEHHDHDHQAHDGGHAHHDTHSEHGQHHEDQGASGIEWEDDMVDVNRLTTSANTRWHVVDRETGAVGHEIDWQFRVGERVKLRLVNEMDSDHPMHHPFHIHGAGRFLILARDGVPESNLVWKDTVLVRTGETVDVLLDVTHPGRWMAHCHIAEHHESGMMFNFTVVP